jgi:catecholate siderophore receptor
MSDIFVDGIRDAGGQSRDVFALEQIEVIKGPGSAFTGRGSTGGSVNLVTKSARATDFAVATATVGTDATYRATADVNEAIGDNIAVRLNMLYSENDVAGRDAVSGSRWGVAPSIAFGLGGPRRATLDYYHFESDELPDMGLPYMRTVVNGVAHGVPIEGHDDDFYGLVGRDFRDNRTDIGTLRLEQDVGETLRLSNATRFGRTSNAYVATNPDDSKGNVANGFVVRLTKNRNTETDTAANTTNVSGEFQLGGLTHSFLAGLEVSSEKTHSQGYIVAGPGLTAGAGAPLVIGTAGCNAGNVGAPSAYNCTALDNPDPYDPWVGTVTRNPNYTDTRVNTGALYLFDTIDFSDRWSLNLGVRHDDYSNVAVATTAAGQTRLRNEASFWNYQAGLVFKPTPDSSLYVAYGTSSNPSGEGAGDGTSVAANTVNLDPEENRSYEIGAKANIGRLNVTLAAFRTEKTNARETDAAGVLSLIGEQRVDGVELSVSGNITPKWSVFGGYTWQDAVLVDAGFSGGAPSPNNGNAFPNTPKQAASFWTTYEISDRFTVGGGGSYMSMRYANPANTYSVPSYVRLDAMASWRLTDKVDLRLNLQNLTDERYVERPYTTHMYVVAAGRSALLSASYRF